MRFSTFENVLDALLQVNFLFDLEEETGDFPEPEWIEAKRLVKKALDELKEMNK